MLNKRNIRVYSMLGMRRVVGQMLHDYMQDENIIFLTADVGRYFGIEKAQEKYKDRILDVGIAEQNLVGIAGGFAKEGFNTFASSYATFLTARALDFVRVNMGYMKLNIKLISVGGGACESDLSATHMGLEDLSNMLAIPNISVFCPSDSASLVKLLLELKNYNKPSYIRLTGKTNLPMIYKENFDFKIGKANVLKRGKDIAIITNGVITNTAILVADMLKDDNIDVSVIDMHTIRPFDTDTLDEFLSAKMFVCLQEHMINSGMSSYISSYLAKRKNSPIFLDLGFENYLDADEYENVLDSANLSLDKVYKKIKDSFLSI